MAEGILEGLFYGGCVALVILFLLLLWQLKNNKK